ncbi:hypothetical protein LTR04_005796 [Oleoguttula sp. CCFEE 6159]|nr:hypothetical protein LTR04_005796 [Oleoguttula sp. CCFEE 6159]
MADNWASGAAPGPLGTLDPASQQKLAEIKEKMGSLERTLEQDVARKASGTQSSPNGGLQLPGPADGDSADEAIPEDEKDLEPSVFATEDAAYDEGADDELLDLGFQLGRMRMTERIGGFVRPRLADELNHTLEDPRAFRGIQEPSRIRVPSRPRSPQTSSPSITSPLAPGATYIPPSSSFFFVAQPQRSSLSHYLPSKTAADTLVKQYFQAVHYLARTVHRPSFERQYEVFWKDVSNGIEPPNSLQAMVFAAMLSAVVSMSEDRVMQEFGVAKAGLIDTFRLATEMALSKANFLRTTKVETLQALVMYLIPLCRGEVSRAHSALTGTAIRLAECMSLHRDGSHYRLSPVETHVRRLVWYQLCFLDLRTCEATGPRPQIRKDDFDTKLPLNVNDTDLESLDPPTHDAKTWTDMTLTRIRFECNEMHRTIWFERPRIDNKKTTLTALLGKVQKFRAAIEEKYLPLIDDTVPIQHLTRHVYGILSNRFHVMVLHRYHNSVSLKLPDRLRQIILDSGTRVVEHAITIETLPSLKTWAWYSGALQQYHSALLLLLDVYESPMRKEADRIWKCLDYVFELPPNLCRDDKARLVLGDLRDKTTAYRTLRKVRAPTLMDAFVGSRRSISNPVEEHARSNTAAAGVPASAEFDFNNFHGVANGQALLAQQFQWSPPAVTDESSNPMESRAGSVSGPNDLEVIMNIDWNEWDKFFPPDLNNGEINVPDWDASSVYYQQQSYPSAIFPSDNTGYQ